jgi:hypothetical protein
MVLLHVSPHVIKATPVGAGHQLLLGPGNFAKNYHLRQRQQIAISLGVFCVENLREIWRQLLGVAWWL